MAPNLYAMDRSFVRATTSTAAGARSEIPAAVLEAARIPGVPTEDCCFAQLLNPRGLEVDYFVSHWWGHPFEQTVNALSSFAEAACEDFEKRSPDGVVFWVCLFALNQHRA